MTRGRQAAFFLPTDTSKWDDDLVRRIAAEGHTAAFLLQADSKTDGADMLADLAAANERLTLLTGVAAPIAANQSGSDASPKHSAACFIGAGYRLWDAGLDSGDAEKNAAEAYTQTVQYFASTSGVVVVAASQQGNPETDRKRFVLVYRTAGYYFGRTHYIQRCAGQQCIRYPMKGELYEADLMWMIKAASAFNHRRQSRDRAERAHSYALRYTRLWISPYTAKLFGADTAVRLCIAEDCLERAEEDDYCFAEVHNPAPYLNRVQQVILYHWNRVYPADRYFTLPETGWTKQSETEFAGSSHEKNNRGSIC